MGAQGQCRTPIPTLPPSRGKGFETAFLRRHTGATSYLVALTREPQRLDLDGQPAGEITEEHLKAAQEAAAGKAEAIEAELTEEIDKLDPQK